MGARLEVNRLSKYFVAGGKAFKAVDDVSFSLPEGTCMGLVGESGSGKSTVAKMIMRFERPDTGTVLLNGNDVWDHRSLRRKDTYRLVQMVFQNPFDSFNPFRTIGSLLRETAVNFGTPRSEADAAVGRILALVGLDEQVAARFRHQVSGGECQRAAIARSLLASPSILICDEATSALDVSVQAQIIDLLARLHDASGISILFISHDLAVVQQLCEKVIVLRSGQMVESGPTDEVLSHPSHPYTKELIDSIYDMPQAVTDAAALEEAEAEKGRGA